MQLYKINGSLFDIIYEPKPYENLLVDAYGNAIDGPATLMDILVPLIYLIGLVLLMMALYKALITFRFQQRII